MTTLWRCCKRKWISGAFTGEGARHADGRWHSPGRRIVYTSDQASLALVEILANGWPFDQALRLHVLVSCEFPEDQIYTVPMDKLPSEWNTVEPAAVTQEWGVRWLNEMKHAAVRVPSAVLPGTNVLINPLHPLTAGALVPAEEHLEWDPRLVRAKRPT